MVDSCSGHMTGVRTRSPVGGAREATTHWCFSPSFSFPSPFSKNKINKILKNNNNWSSSAYCVRGTVLRAFHLGQFTPMTIPLMLFIIFISQMRTLRHREVKWLTQHHSAGRRHTQDLHLGSLTWKFMILTTLLHCRWVCLLCDEINYVSPPKYGK